MGMRGDNRFRRGMVDRRWEMGDNCHKTIGSDPGLQLFHIRHRPSAVLCRKTAAQVI
jgi:hypothetical protein